MKTWAKRKQLIGKQVEGRYIVLSCEEEKNESDRREKIGKRKKKHVTTDRKGKPKEDDFFFLLLLYEENKPQVKGKKEIARNESRSKENTSNRKWVKYYTK